MDFDFFSPRGMKSCMLSRPRTALELPVSECLGLVDTTVRSNKVVYYALIEMKKQPLRACIRADANYHLEENYISCHRDDS